MQEPTLSRDTQAVLLLCGRFSPRENVDPLDLREYNRLLDLLHERSLRPASLLEEDITGVDWTAAGIDAGRIANLLARAMGLGLATERWANGGLWVISRSDDAYPPRLRQHLGRSAPPLLWGVGDIEIAASGGVAVVGSRDVDEAGGEWAGDVAAESARQGLTVISGGARGVDQIAMSSGLAAGGRVVAVLPEGLGKPSVVARYREAVLDQRLVLLSPFYPDAGFTIGNAMARNKVMYGLADAAVIVRADANQGGSWAGAEEELKRDNAIPVFVRAGEALEDGNRALMSIGARPLPAPPWQDLRAIFTSRADSAATAIRDRAVIEPAPAVAPETVYEAVLPLLLRCFADPATVKAAAERLDVQEKQVKKWVERAVAEGHLARAKGRGVKYLAATTVQAVGDAGQKTLFGTKGRH